MIRKILRVFLLLGTAVHAAEVPPPTTAEGVLSFAQSLLSSGDSFRAATEYLRFLHHYGDHPRTSDALRGLGGAYAQAGRWDDAAESFRKLSSLGSDPQARWLLGWALYRGARYPEAARTLLGPERGEAEQILGTLAFLRAGAAGPPPPEARDDLVQEFSDIPRKSPLLAGTLSAALPGAGHLYAGRPRDAITSFLLNGAFLWGTYEAARREQWAVAGILGFFELGWYSGNVVSSVNAAHKWNRREEGRFYERWESGAVPRWSIAPLPSGGILSLAWNW